MNLFVDFTINNKQITQFSSFRIEHLAENCIMTVLNDIEILTYCAHHMTSLNKMNY